VRRDVHGRVWAVLGLYEGLLPAPAEAEWWSFVVRDVFPGGGNVRWAAKRDANEGDIVKALEAAGWLVMKISDKGAPDLLCARKGVLKLVEVKGPKGKLTPAQVESHQRLAASLVTVHVVTTPEEALAAVGAVVEGVLEPAATVERFSDPGNDTDDTKPFAFPRSGIRVTPAYQKEQTEAVVPPKKVRGLELLFEPETYDTVFGAASEPPKKRGKK
jgi:hypothetical protein